MKYMLNIILYQDINCDASTAPINGTVGTCTSVLVANKTCQPICNNGFTVSGATTCINGVFEAAVCNISNVFNFFKLLFFISI